MIQDGKHVKFNFMLNADGKIIESTKGVPFEYVHGKDKILPGLKDGLEGLKVGDEKTIILEPENAYGQENEQAYKDFPIDSLPEDLKPELGLTLEVKNETGQKTYGVISKIKKDDVTLNLNHPLAGKTLTFMVKIMEIN